MKIARRSFSLLSHQRGFTVVELLIAGVLGLVLLAGVGQLFVGSSSTFRMQRQIADVQDSGRFALSFIKDDFERAAWFVADSRDPATIPTDPADFPVTGLDGGDDANDELTIRYEGDTDCNGNAVGSVVNRYFIDNRQLMCEGNGGDPQPLVANVDSFQVLFGWDDQYPPEANTDDQCLDRAADQYLTATALSDAWALAPQPDANRVVSVRISLLIGGETNSSVPRVNRPYQVADRTVEFDDQILRRVFNLTITARNVDSGPTDCPKVP